MNSKTYRAAAPPPSGADPGGVTGFGESIRATGDSGDPK